MPSNAFHNNMTFDFDFNVSATDFESNATTQPAIDLTNMGLSSLPDMAHETLLLLGGHAAESTASQFQPFEYTSFAAVPHMAFWEDPQFMAPVYQDLYTDLGEPFFSLQEPPSTARGSLPDHEAESDTSDSEMDLPPVPSFFGARASPEPQQGQVLSFLDFLGKAWPDQGRERDWNGKSRFTDLRTGEIRYPPPLMGTFSPLLSAHDSVDLWEPENLAHVKRLPPTTYTVIVANFRELNSTTSQYNQFVAGEFLSLAACNAFMQLYFEEFNEVFPLVHQPSFDPTTEPWLLILAIIAIGCRFSQQTAAVECADILQEFVHRAFQATVRKSSRACGVD